ncbi:MAG: hypothetical protein AB4368_05530 [Xenococcaceae cyanobacterium]
MKPFGKKPSYEELVDKLIEASTLEDFLKIQALFIPDESVNAWFQEKDKQLDLLSSRCAWEKYEFQLTSEELKARERWKKIRAELKEYEERFCL